MNPPIGFVILVNPFNPIHQTERLILKLNRMFDNPPIACHHDFGKTPRFIEPLPSNVKMVHPHVDTKWADFSCLEAATRALGLLYSDKSAPDWFVYLSGSDYPIQPAEVILTKLKSSPFDAHIDCQLITEKEGTAEDSQQSLEGENPLRFSSTDWWKKGCRERYLSYRIVLPWINRKFALTTKVLRLRHPWLVRWKLPFAKDFQCYAGEAWFCANRRAAKAIIDFHRRDQKLAAHYNTAIVPEEAYFQTILGNARGIRISPDYLRFTDWTGMGNHPKLLTMEDLPNLKRSRAHFARKFDDRVDGIILDEMDALTEPVWDNGASQTCDGNR